MKTRNQLILALVLVLAAFGTVALFGMNAAPQEGAGGAMEGHDHAAMLAGAKEAQPVHLDEEAGGRIGVTYTQVTRGTLVQSVVTVGFVSYDETRLSVVNAKIAGWVERLYVDFTGAPVRSGQPLLEVYSPELITAQEELLLAKRLLVEVEEEGGSVRSAENAKSLLEAARRRLAYWDIPEDQIRAIEERGTVARTVTLRAPAGGIVVEKNVVEGARIRPGMDLLLVADLSRVWVEVEIFEKDISLISEGQHAMVSFDAYPGEMFHGSLTYVYPTVSHQSRTGRARLELSNPELKLRPGMYARVELQVSGREDALLIPRSAVLVTGERSVVFHRGEGGELHPREVTLGLANSTEVEVLSGLEEGDVVVSSAAFLIDAESNLGSSMADMAGTGEGEMDAGDTVDHSGHDMGSMEPDTGVATVDHEQMDHSGHEMPAVGPDTTEANSGHEGHTMPAADTLKAMPDTTGTGVGKHRGATPGGREG